MTGWRRFWIGGGGALLPLLVTLLAIDINGLIQHAGDYSVGVYIGAAIRYIILFVLGGVVAALNVDEYKPIKLVQLGIAAPALVASFVNAQPGLPTQATTPAPIHAPGSSGLLDFVSPAYGMDMRPHSHRIVLAGSFLADVLKGISRPLSAVPAQSAKQSVDKQALERAIEDARKSAAQAATAADKAALAANKAAAEPSAEAIAAAKQTASDASAAAQKAQADVKALQGAASAAQ